MSNVAPVDPNKTETSQIQKESENKNFQRFLRFGTVDSGLLIISILAGFSLEAKIAKHVGAKGYGPIIGAGIGNATADFIAGLPDGKWAALGVGAGALLPMAPIFMAMGLKRELAGRTSQVLAGTCAVLVGGTFLHGYFARTGEE